MDARQRVTVYGRKPVLEVLGDERIDVVRLLLDRRARGEPAEAIVAAASARGVRVQRVPAEKVTRVSGNGRHDQGVVAEVDAPGIQDLDGWAAGLAEGAGAVVLVLDGVTNPANVGMVVRTVAAAGLEGLVLPEVGSPDVGPLVVKASAGTAFTAPILRATSAVSALDVLGSAGFRRLGLSSGAGEALYEAGIPARTALVLGSETHGISAAAAERLDGWSSIPVRAGVESLNVASAAAVAAYEVVRRRWAVSRSRARPT